MGKDGLIVSHDETGEEAVALKDIFETLAAFKDTRINCDLKEYGLEEERPGSGPRLRSSSQAYPVFRQRKACGAVPWSVPGGKWKCSGMWKNASRMYTRWMNQGQGNPLTGRRDRKADRRLQEI